MTVAEYNESVDLYADSLYRFLKKSMGDADKAEDIVQDTYEKVWREYKVVKYENIRSYIYSAAYLFMLKEFRREREYSPMRVEDIEKLGEESGGQYTDYKEVLDQVLQRMPPEQRTVIVLRDFEGYTYEEIANVTEISVLNVRKYVFRAREVFKKYLVSIENII
jgi:RNA polymerase sigma factor (sigma-70 family)